MERFGLGALKKYIGTPFLLKSEYDQEMSQWHTADKSVARTLKGRLPYQAKILFNCTPFHNGNFS